MATRRKLPNNQRSIDAVKPTPERKHYSIENCTGLQLDVLPSGVKRWRAYGRTPAGKRVWKTIGTAEAISVGRAADEARKFVEAAALGDLDAGNNHRPTFADLFERWHAYTEQHKRPSSRDEDRRLYERTIKPHLGDAVLGFAPADRHKIIAALDTIARDRTPIQANRAQAVISTVFSFALDEGLVDLHPASRIRKRGAETSRSPDFSSAEIATIWRATATMHPSVAAAIRLLMLLGSRRSEIAEAERREIDLNERTLSIRAERRKSWRVGDPKSPHIVPLDAVSLEIVRGALDQQAESDFLFPSRSILKRAPMSADNLTATFAALVRKYNLGDKRLHDLRHMVKTGMTSIGVPPFIADRVQDHAPDRGSGARYDRYSYLDEKRKALALWQRRLMAIVEGREPPAERW